MKLLFGFICGFLFAASIRPWYNMITGKDIPLFKYPYKTNKDGSVEIEYPANNQINSD